MAIGKTLAVATIEAVIEETLIDGPKGKDQDGVTLTCGDCDHTVSKPGYDTPEMRRCLIECLNETCPEKRHHKVKVVE